MVASHHVALTFGVFLILAQAVAPASEPLSPNPKPRSILEGLKQTKVNVKFQLAFNPKAEKSRVFALNTFVNVQTPELIDVQNKTTIQRPGHDIDTVRTQTDIQWRSATKHDLTTLLLEKPEYIVCGADRPGAAVWFVNGILTSRRQAATIGGRISERLNRRVHVLHNASIIEAPYESGLEAKYLKDDLSESAYDRIWPALIAGQLFTESVTLDAVQFEGALQRNHVTRQLAWVLYHSQEPVSLITHSQGCLIARNALFTMSLLGRQEQARDNVAWVAAGIPLHECEVCHCPKRMSVLDCRLDPVPRFLGLRGGGFDCDPSHHDFLRNYLDQLTPEQLFPPTN